MTVDVSAHQPCPRGTQGPKQSFSFLLYEAQEGQSTTKVPLVDRVIPSRCPLISKALADRFRGCWEGWEESRKAEGGSGPKQPVLPLPSFDKFSTSVKVRWTVALAQH